MFTASMGAGECERAHTNEAPKMGLLFGPFSRAVYIVLVMGGDRQSAPILGPRFSHFCSFSRNACAGLWSLVAGTVAMLAFGFGSPAHSSARPFSCVQAHWLDKADATYIVQFCYHALDSLSCPTLPCSGLLWLALPSPTLLCTAPVLFYIHATASTVYMLHFIEGVFPIGNSCGDAGF